MKSACIILTDLVKARGWFLRTGHSLQRVESTAGLPQRVYMSVMFLVNVSNPFGCNI